MDILLDENHDIIFKSGSQSPVTDSLGESVKQRLKIRLLTYLGEWFLDATEGIPYFQYILGSKGNKKTNVDLLFQEAILKDPNISSIKEFNSALSREREYSLSFSVLTKTGETVEADFNIGV